MPRTLGWKNQNIKGDSGKRKDKDKKLSFKKGITYYGRVMTECKHYREHRITDVLEPDPETGEERAFGLNCRKEWVPDKDEPDDEEKGSWEGDCGSCEGGYDLSDKFAAGFMLLAEVKGKGDKKRVQKIDPENSIFVWPFGKDKYAKIRDVALSLDEADPPKRLRDVELVIKLDEEDKSAEKFQKVNIVVSQGKPLMTKEHAAYWKETGKAEAKELISQWADSPSEDEEKRNLKKKKPKNGGGSKGKKSDDGDDSADADDLGLGDDDADEKPAKKKAKAKKSDEDEAPAKKGKKAKVKAAKSSGDDDVDDILGDLDD